MPKFFDKEKYVINYETLQLYLRLELKLKKIHLVLQFSNSQCVKLYIECNTQKKTSSRKKWM